MFPHVIAEVLKQRTTLLMELLKQDDLTILVSNLDISF